jgi:PhnB protein
MASTVKPIPDGYHTATPYLIVSGAAKALEFYKNAFGATELFRMPQPDGRIGHAEIQIGNSRIMLADEHHEIGAKSPQTIGGSAVSILLYVEDADRVFNQAAAAGAKVTRPLENQFYGDRMGGLTDPFGHAWYVATHVEDVSPEELQKRAAAAHGRE